MLTSSFHLYLRGVWKSWCDSSGSWWFAFQKPWAQGPNAGLPFCVLPAGVAFVRTHLLRGCWGRLLLLLSKCFRKARGVCGFCFVPGHSKFPCVRVWLPPGVTVAPCNCWGKTEVMISLVQGVWKMILFRMFVSVMNAHMESLIQIRSQAGIWHPYWNCPSKSLWIWGQ